MTTRRTKKDWIRDNPERHAESVRRRRKKNYVKMLLYRIRRKCDRWGWEFDIDESDVVIPLWCPVLGIRIVLDVGKGRSDNTPSLDRIDNQLGYVKGNVEVISWRANRLKSDATPDELRRLAKYYGRKNHS